MLYEFLRANRDQILSLAEEKTKNLAGLRKSSDQLKLGLPLFYGQLLKVLEQQLSHHTQKALLEAAASHGKEFLSLGYSLSHVVHSYGSMCQAITELASMKNADISANEFNILNGCLDVAIASAVSEFQYRSNEANEDREIKHLGYLAHELRNALSGATIAQQMIMDGLVGVGGSTAKVLMENLTRMGSLIDRSLSEVRMRSDADLYIEKFHLADLIDQILITADTAAKKRHQSINVDVNWDIELEADRQFLLSAVGNLVQNAMKYSKSHSIISIKGRLSGNLVTIDVQDQCGGISTEKLASLFDPKIQAHHNPSGLGLGLSISQRAVHLNQGTIKVENYPGKGCLFKIEIPQKVIPQPTKKQTVPGKDAVQPGFGKKPELP